MNKQVTIQLPKQDNAGLDITHTHAPILEEVLSICGGYTISHTQGAWRDDEGNLYLDNHLECKTLVNTDAQLARLSDLAERAAEEMRQECILLTITDMESQFIYQRVKEAA